MTKSRACLNGHFIRSSIQSSERASIAALSVTCSVIVITNRLDDSRRGWRGGVINPRFVGEQADERSVVKVLGCKSQHQNAINLGACERTPFPPQVSVSSETQA